MWDTSKENMSVAVLFGALNAGVISLHLIIENIFMNSYIVVILFQEIMRPITFRDTISRFGRGY